ncbi:MAG: GDSL-type esterase/lipase family protein [Bacteroides sp.]|nr:GDSL-type esterase/lipase family protein [Eubacterium sp.]MCM1417502.1 GDSL-type esterase/lipase family protein [Roseburia sp.]MCM1462537.1 GDSL-type esterase/lipase family protein [Bacteroides sp.]
MKQPKLLSRLLAALLLIAAGGCVNIADRTLPETSATTVTTPPPSEIKTVSVATTTSEKSAPESAFITTADAPEAEVYHDFPLSDADRGFLDGCVFVGDSICSGLMFYDILTPEQVAAQGNIAARNIFDFTFTEDGAELSLLSLLVDRKPETVVFSMGMNDVNITSKQEFAENYKNLLRTAEGFLPDARLVVLSITPVEEDSAFTANETIDLFNEALAEMIAENEKWVYVDVSPEMKNSRNALKTNYNGGDGIHLSPDAYAAILGQLCDRLVIDNDPDIVISD